MHEYSMYINEYAIVNLELDLYRIKVSVRNRNKIEPFDPILINT